MRQNYAEKIAVFRSFLAKSCTNWYVNVSNDEKLFLIFLIIFIFYFTQKLHIFILETIEIVWVFFKSVRLSCREQICSNLLATIVWGHILSKENDCARSCSLLVSSFHCYSEISQQTTTKIMIPLNYWTLMSSMYFCQL